MVKHLPHISIEKYAAYLDCNLPDEEIRQMKAFIDNDSEMQAVLETDSNIEADFDLDLIDNEPVPFEMELPSIELPTLDLYSPIEQSGFIDEIFSLESDSFEEETGSIENERNNEKKLINMEREIYYANAHFGEDPLIDVSGEVYQWYQDTCAVKSQQLVLERFGIDVPQEMLMEIAENNGWYHVDGGMGTPMNCIGNLLEYYNIPTTSVVGANVGNLVAELAQGHQIIVGVDSGELHHGPIRETLRDFFLGGTPDHALIVAGIDLSDPNHSYVVLKDPGTGDVAKPYPLEQFIDAWKDSQCFMVSTDIPTPDFNMQHIALGTIQGVSLDSFLAANNIHDYEHLTFDVNEILNNWMDMENDSIANELLDDREYNFDGEDDFEDSFFDEDDSLDSHEEMSFEEDDPDFEDDNDDSFTIEDNSFDIF
ncbi:MAG: hypothetical protein IJP44_14135 [Bacteroidales bacterium]|nr:hypothetical protein [Bacteroidales bacterium]